MFQIEVLLQPQIKYISNQGNAIVPISHKPFDEDQGVCSFALAEQEKEMAGHLTDEMESFESHQLVAPDSGKFIPDMTSTFKEE